MAMTGAEEAALDPMDRPIFRARLVAHRSLSRRGRKVLVVFFALGSALASLPFFMMGAWPVVGFFGLDVALLWGALALNARGARAYEDVVVTPLEVRLAQISEKGGRRDWRFSTLWSRLRRRSDDEFGVLHLYLDHRGQSVEIARVLGPPEKEDFAQALTGALAEAKRGPVYDHPH
jgi:uncharacterized membrane protein